MIGHNNCFQISGWDCFQPACFLSAHVVRPMLAHTGSSNRHATAGHYAFLTGECFRQVGRTDLRSDDYPVHILHRIMNLPKIQCGWPCRLVNPDILFVQE
jgi:hypothetical protein